MGHEKLYLIVLVYNSTCIYQTLIRSIPTEEARRSSSVAIREFCYPNKHIWRVLSTSYCIFTGRFFFKSRYSDVLDDMAEREQTEAMTSLWSKTTYPYFPPSHLQGHTLFMV
jgi:hypothetical protein